MSVKKLIEKLEDLATFLTLAANDADKEAKTAENKSDLGHSYFHDGKAKAYNTAFNKVDGLIKEAKR